MKVRKDSLEVGAWRKFRLLMWKNFLQQWRHRLQTFVELLLPVMTMCLVLIVRQQIEPVKNNAITYPTIPAYTLNYSIPVLAGLNISQVSIAYSPRSPAIQDVLVKAVLNLVVHNIDDLIAIIIQQEPDFPNIPIEIPPDIDINDPIIMEIAKYFIRITPYNKSSELRGIYSDEQTVRQVIAAVEFDDILLGSTVLPANISYSLRFPERPRLNSFLNMGGRTWRTHIIFPHFELPGPRFPYSWEGGNDPGYVNEMFIAIQHAISMELISGLTGQNLQKFNVHIQRYPYPPYVEDLAVEALVFLFPMFFMLSFSYTAVNIVRSVTVEKELQLKETMKIMGLPTWLHWTAWFCKQFIYLFMTAGLIMIILKVNWFTSEQGFSGYAVFTNTHWTVLYFYIMLYLSCTICFCFMISGFFSKGNTAALFGGVVWFMTFIPAALLNLDFEVPVAVQAISCFSINSAMSFGFQLILNKENTGGMQWGEFLTANSLESNRLLFGHVCIFLVVDSILYMLIALYLEQVLPGPFGAPKPLYFVFQKSFWCSKASDDFDDKHNHTPDIDESVKEKDPTELGIGVKMVNLTKVYGKNIAVNNISLNIYDDQITVLLGHNGAGKSTTISMLTGNVEVTRGSIWVAGYNITTQASLARAHIGLCPQHNVLFNELTVREHLEFFARLKGYSGNELDEDINNLIDRLEMQEKRNYLAEGLSGGQKRRLCVGIALSGGAQVVLLDEPTSGMDPASRRALWDLLQKEKKGRTMILTTHFMDEADYLGDRVAIMSSGRLQCVGSPYFLKQHYGIGYTLVIVKNKSFQIEYCTALISKYIPGTMIKDDRGMEVTYNLPNNYSHVFEDMLNDLESKADIIHFKDYGLVATTLEDVFMSVGSDVEINSVSEDTIVTTDISDGKTNSIDDLSLEHLDNSEESETGCRLFWLHVSAVWLKLFLVWTRSWGLLLLQIVVPIVLINTSLGILRYLSANQATVISRPLTLTQGYINTETFLTFNGTNSSSLGALAYQGYQTLFNEEDVESMKLTVVDGQSIDDYYLQRMTSDPSIIGTLRNRLLIGATLDEDTVIAWFSNFGYHDVATSLATLHSAILKGINPSASIEVFNHPIEVNYQDTRHAQLMMSLMSMQVAASVGNSLAIVSAVFIMFYIKERVTRAKLLQRASGMQPALMWAAASVYDWFWFLLVSQTVLISCTAFGVQGLSNSTELGRLFLCLMVYGAAMLPLQYLFSLVFNGPALGFIIVFFINVIFGLIGAQIVEALSSPMLDTGAAADILDNILPFYPLYSLVTSTRILNQVGLRKHTCMEACDYLLSVLPNMEECTMQTLCQNFSRTCCIRDNPFFEWEEPGILRYITCTIATCAFLWFLLMIIEYNCIGKLLIRERKPPPVDESTLDADVANEMRHAQRGNLSPTDVALVTHGLTKYYKDNLAVNQISFTVSEAECFGLLGVNGAGKTTTFKMLMGDETVSSGDAFVSGFSVKKDITKVYENIGYCPQFDAVFGELTGRETIHLFSRFRGLKNSSSSVRAEILANALGFIKHLDKKVYQYSGGNKRKLSTAVAMLGRSRLIFVDEPTTGVDPAAKRQVWRAVRAARRAGRAFVLTSHSMEECEALCSRLTIMVNGQFQCLGSPQHLKNKFSEGFTLTVKIKLDEDRTRSSNSSADRTEAVKNYISTHYNNVRLMEEYQGLITYYLPDRSMPWSRMFGIMEQAKRELDVEDYSILQTTLEQIFLQFTKYQREVQK